MPEITVLFRGICTHFSKTAIADLPVPHRVVLPDTIDPPRIAQGRLVPHLAFLYFLRDEERCAPDNSAFFSGYPLMNNVRLTVPVPEEKVTLENWDGIPKLTFFRPDYQPDPYVVLNGNAACYFDVPSGRIEAIRMSLGEWYTKLTVTNAERRVITAHAYGMQHDIEIPDGHCVVVRHLALPAGTHSPDDFRLHYLTAKGSIPRFFEHPLPGEPSYPGPKYTTARADTWSDLMTPACSNSSYP